MTKINPKKNNKSDSKTTTQCVMADSGAMCSLLNFKMVEDMGLIPEELETSNVSITGVNGKKLQSVTNRTSNTMFKEFPKNRFQCMLNNICNDIIKGIIKEIIKGMFRYSFIDFIILIYGSSQEYTQ